MKNSISRITFFFSLIFCLFISFLTFAQEEEPQIRQEAPVTVAEKAAPEKTSYSPNYNDNKLALGVGLGAMVSPAMFSARVHAEYIFDGIFSLGPNIWCSFDSNNQYVAFTIDGKFKFPLPGITDSLRFVALTGLGYLFKSQPAFTKHDFTAHGGIGAEYFFIENLSVGAEILAGTTSDSNDRFFMNFLLGANYYL